MTTETFTPAPKYTISGTGPYAIPHAYGASDIVVVVADAAGNSTTLAASDFTLAPATSQTTGDLSLTSTAATTHAGKSMFILRDTKVEQGWAGINGYREAGLEAQLDVLARALQDRRTTEKKSLHVLDPLFDATLPVPQANRTIIYNPAASGFVIGPSADEISGAQSDAQAAQAAAAAAAASQTSAAAALDEFTDIYLGVKSSDPALDNDGNALQAGALYFNSTTKKFRVYTGGVWQDALDGVAPAELTKYVKKANVYSGDLNAFSAGMSAGLYVLQITGAATNGFPNTNTGDWVLVYKWDDNTEIQIGYNWGGSPPTASYIRRKITGSWEAWRRTDVVYATQQETLDGLVANKATDPVGVASHVQNKIKYIGWQKAPNTNNGVLYGSSSSDPYHGSVAEVISPDFEDGFEYKFVLVDLAAPGNTSFGCELFYELGNNYSPVLSVSDNSAGIHNGSIILPNPRLLRRSHFMHPVTTSGTAAGNNNANSIVRTTGTATPDKIRKIRLKWASGNINGGKIYMFRRKDGIA